MDALYRALFEHSIDCVLITTGAGVVVRANPAACRAFGLSEAALRRRGRGDRVVDDGPLRAFLARRERAGEARGELLLRRADGSLFPAEVTSSAIRASDGRSYRCIIFRDVTDRRRAEEEIREREEEARARAVQLEAVLDCIADGVIVYDRQGRTVRSSPAADQILGLPASARRGPVGERVMAQYEVRSEDGRLLGPDEMVAVRAAVRGEAVVGEIQQVRALGSEPRWLLISGVPLRISGEHVGAVVSLTDITERKRAEHALRQSEQSLREADRRKNEFLGMLSHELRNPLAPIRNSVLVLRQADPRGEHAIRARAVIER